MAYQVLARKWRPQAFGEVVGQGHVTRALQNAVQGGKISHAYLFSGPRGVGKTSMARILAKSLNCEKGPTPSPCNECASCLEITAGSSVDVLEIDGASNTKVEEIRDLNETVKYTPFQGRNKIYVIDEVHMLSNHAFNALLKTLEEPPPHMVFVLATTEPHKIPATVRSRCQHYQFRRIARRDMVEHLRQVVAKESIEIGEPELYLLAKVAEGSLRDALSFLDQVVAYGGPKVREEDLLLVMGVVDRQHLLDIMMAIQKSDAAQALEKVRELVVQGHDLRQFCHELVELVRDLTMFKVAQKPEALVECSPDEFKDLQALSEGFSADQLQWLFRIFAQAHDEIRYFFHPPFLLEMVVVQAARLDPGEPLSDVLNKLGEMEKRVQNSGGSAPDRSSAPENPGRPKKPEPRKIPPPKQPEKASPPNPPQAQAEPEISLEMEAESEMMEIPPDPVPPGQTGTPDHWRQVIQDVRKHRPALASYLEQGALAEVSEKVLVINYSESNSFFKDRVLKTENAELIQGIIRTHFGRDLKMQAVIISGPGISVKKTQVVSPVVEDALKTLGGEIVTNDS